MAAVAGYIAAMLAVLALLALPACGGPSASAPAAPIQATAPPPTAPRETGTVHIVCFGDSITAGLGLPPTDAYPAVLGRSLTAAGLTVDVVNAGVSGDTTAGGLRRVDWTLQQHPDVFVLALGGNDMLRGLPVAETRSNLEAILGKAEAAGAAVVLAGMRANPTLGADYVTAFDAIFPTLAAEHRAPLLPFLLEGVAGDPALTQADGLHPTAEGQRRIAERLLPLVEPVVRARR